MKFCRAASITTKRILNPLYRVPWIFRFTSFYEEQRKALKKIHSFSREAIAIRRQQTDENEKNSGQVPLEEVDLDLGIKSRPKLFIDIMLNATVNGQPLSDEDIREEIDTFIFAVKTEI
jgi:cytochrome P450 family 4